MDIQRKRSLIPGPVVAGVVVLLLACLAVGATFYYFVEGLTLVDAIYFASMTLTTVGYGDFVPRTDLGKIFTAVYAFAGIGVFLGFAAMLSQVALNRIHQVHQSFKDNHKQ